MTVTEYQDVLCYHMDKVTNPTWIRVQLTNDRVWASDNTFQIHKFLREYQSWLASGGMVLKVQPKETCENEENQSTTTCAHNGIKH